MYKIFFTKKWLMYFCICLICIFTCISLGFWQLERRQTKLQTISAVTENYTQNPLNFFAAEQLLQNLENQQEWTPVSLQGKYDVSQQRIVRNRPNNGQVGYEILVPFILPTGKSLLVNRGWVPLGNINSGYPDHVPQPYSEGEINLVIRLRSPEPNLGRTAPAGQIASIDTHQLAQELPYPIFLGSYGIMVNETPAANENPLPLQKPDLDEGSHLSYAMQWFMFGLLFLVGFFYALRQESKHLSGKKPNKQPRVEVEDQILDSQH